MDPTPIGSNCFMPSPSVVSWRQAKLSPSRSASHTSRGSAADSRTTARRLRSLETLKACWLERVIPTGPDHSFLIGPPVIDTSQKTDFNASNARNSSELPSALHSIQLTLPP